MLPALIALSTPTLNLDLTSVLQTMFDYASTIFSALGPVTGIGVGFALGVALLGWVGSMIIRAFRGTGSK